MSHQIDVVTDEIERLERELAEAIPPAYTHWIGQQFKAWQKDKAA
jgi:hypothetical protein